MEKTQNKNIINRLIKYTIPYKKTILALLILMILSTAFDLMRPYILKITIDDHINGYLKPMSIVEVQDEKHDFIFKDYKFVRDGDLKNYDAIIRNKNGKYILEIKAENKFFILDNEDLKLFRKNDQTNIIKTGLFFLSIILAKFLSDYLQVLWLNRISQNIIFTIRENSFSHLISRNLSFFDKTPTGRLVTIVTNDAENLNEMYTSVLLNLFKDTLLLLGITLVMFRMNTELALISFAIVPIIFFLSFFFRKLIRENFRKSRKKLSELNTSISENISGIKISQAFAMEGKVNDKFDKLNQSYLKIAKEEVFLFSVFRPSLELIRSLGIAALIWFGGLRNMGGLLEFGVLYAFIDYLQRFLEPILNLTEQFNIMQSAMTSGERIFEYLDNNQKISNANKPQIADLSKGKIEFKNVYFAYTNEDWVLKNISFTIEPGQTIAIVGATGAGKTSIINLLTRSYDIQKGKILIDDVDIKDIDLYELRSQIGVVLQDVFLFSGTIKDNIKIGKEDATDTEIINAASYVNANHFIERLNHGYDEKVMERGSSLSSGERQLLAFARTLLANPSILILDEATASIDTNTEQYIQNALTKISKNRTSIIIAHRLSTIQGADNILVLSKGHLVESGTHEELLKLGKKYSILYRLQAQKN